MLKSDEGIFSITEEDAFTIFLFQQIIHYFSAVGTTGAEGACGTLCS